MKKMIIGGVALLALVGCGGNTDVTEAEKAPKVAEAVTANENSETIAVNTENSKLTWIGRKVVGEHAGELFLSKGEFIVEGDEVKGGSFELDMNSITVTDIENEASNKNLVDHLKAEDFFGTEAHPTGSFEITNCEKKDGDNYAVTGNLTLKGKTEAVAFNATITKGENGWTASAKKIMVDRTKYGITYKSGSFFEGLGDNIIEDNMEIGFVLSTK